MSGLKRAISAGFSLILFLPCLVPPSSAATMYQSADAAAISFITAARGRQDQRKEYCAYVFKAPGGYRVGLEAEGDMDHCPATWPVPAGAVAVVHTHPIWGGGANDPGSFGQTFSDGDYNNAETAGREVSGFVLYLGAPLGHVLRYRSGNTFCRGGSLIKRVFSIIHGPNVMGSLPYRSGEWAPLISPLGDRRPKPGYCREE